jgi:ElaB/YqjD/DUF883 family membrane-anchored ribosome-binding protein
MATIATQITELEAELTALKSAMTSILTSGQSSSMDGINKTRASFESIKARRIEVEKSLQRLKRGGRGMIQDMSYGTGDIVS